MILDMGPMLRGEVDTLAVDYMVKPEPLSGVEFTQDAHVVGQVTDTGGSMRLYLEADMPYSTICARCLDKVEGVYTVCFERTVAEEQSLSQEQIDDNVDEYIIVREGKLDIDEQLVEEMILSFPTKFVCSDDCPGLCPKCGAQLKKGACGCKTKEIDPRLAVLAKLLEESDD